MKKGRALAGICVATAFMAAADPASAQENTDADALAKALANPIAALISVPFQLNFDTGFGADGNGDRWTLNVQPVVPISISDDWNMISRTILPLITQSDVANSGSQSGLGDTIQSLFFSPKALTASGWTWGVGPAFMLPTATDSLLGSGKWAIGPTAVALKQTEAGWTYGFLANHLVSFAGNSNREDVNATFLQPFLTRQLGAGRSVSATIESTYDWENSQWNLPLIFTYTKVSKIGSQMVSYNGGVRAYLDAPAGGPDWGLRFALVLLFPR